MGAACGKSEEGRKNKEIERQQKKNAEQESNKIKILLLGAGESGKSTLFKQMKILFAANADKKKEKFTDEEKQKFKLSIKKNIYKDLWILLMAMDDRQLTFKSKQKARALEGKKFLQKFLIDSKDKSKGDKVDLLLGPTQAAMFKAIWEDRAMKEVWRVRSDIQVQESIEYFMEHIDEIADDKWSPSQADILRTRIQTTGVVTAKFMMDNTSFEMYDVGGQRTERTKWIHYFDEVTTVLFIAAISEYDQVLFEDANVNRQAEAVELFRKQVNLDNFLHTPFILFLNKNDIFRKKLTEFPFCVTEGTAKQLGIMPRNVDFQGPHLDVGKTYSYKEGEEDDAFKTGYTAALEYLKDLYLKQAGEARNPTTIYVHTTNSTDSQNITKIMASCKDIIIRAHFTDGGFI